jgi:dTDP-4-amino-4,6-dideoxygalactose transaminase
MSGYKELFEFESALAEFTGAPFVVATDGCTNALELCLRYDSVTKCESTAFTYLSVPMLMHRLNIEHRMTDETWIGEYQLHGTRIWDSARLLRQGMYRPGQIQCLSFGNTKPLQLGRVGAILLDDADAYYELSRARSDGRDLHVVPWPTQKTFKAGYHFCPTLELCKLGTALLPTVDQVPKEITYNDCRLISII